MTLLRRAAAGDETRLLALIREFCAVDNHDYDEARLRRALGPLLDGDELGVVWLIGEDAGYAVVTWSYSLESGGPDALLDEIYLRDRGRGAGSGAMAEIFADLERRGITRMFLETEAHNARVRRFYARLGFVEEDSIWMCREGADQPG